MRARVKNGQWVFEDPTDLPEGTVVEIVTRPAMPTEPDNVYVDDKVRAYVRALLVAAGDKGATATHEQEITESAKAIALRAHRGYVTPDDVKVAAPTVLCRFASDHVIRAILDQTLVP